jgi:hypothetical protein
MSERLNELQRQRRLVQEHLAWLDKEIAAATPATPASPAGPAAAVVDPLTFPADATRVPSQTDTVSAPDAVADEILVQYQQDPGSLQTDVRRGCITAFIAGMAALLVFVAGAYFLYVKMRAPVQNPPTQVEDRAR